ncbi:ATP-dependent zinc metalloprotease FtsH, partial [Striga asiatica]
FRDDGIRLHRRWKPQISASLQVQIWRFFCSEVRGDVGSGEGVGGGRRRWRRLFANLGIKSDYKDHCLEGQMENGDIDEHMRSNSDAFHFHHTFYHFYDFFFLKNEEKTNC